MIGPRLGGIDEPERELDLDLVFGQRRTTRFNTPTRGPGPAYRQGSGTPGAPREGEAFRPGRDLAARREAFEAGAPSGSFAQTTSPPTRPARPVIPGERQYRDGDRVRHGRWGDGIVVTSKLTRSDEEITATEWAARLGTIAYEIVSGIGPRVPRRYV